jgi:hypothetical protein
MCNGPLAVLVALRKPADVLHVPDLVDKFHWSAARIPQDGFRAWW